MTVSFPLTRSGLAALLESADPQSVYELLDFDYASEMLYSSDPTSVEVAQRRASFIERVDFVCPPTSHEVRRLFNQINTFFAERWACAHLDVNPIELIRTCNDMVLLRQGKRTGFRRHDMAFGKRQVDFVDPLKQYKLLRGIAPQWMEGCLADWARAAQRGPGRFELTLAIMMCLVAIHPFYDGNGRVARIVFTWLGWKWGIGEQWLGEDGDGEFLRTGSGLESTEHIMAALVLRICEGHNRFGPGLVDDGAAAASALRRTLVDLELLVVSREFAVLVDHLRRGGHVRGESPRLKALGGVLREGKRDVAGFGHS